MDLLLLGLLGVALISTFTFDGVDDDDAAPEKAGKTLRYDGSDPLLGTEGNDTLPSGQNPDLAPEIIDLLGGNDTAIVDLEGSMTVRGGDGDDRLTATGIQNILEGGAGNDTLSGDDANQLYGGEGDDVLTFVHGSYDNGDPGTADGGSGDDTITVRSDAILTEEILYNLGGGVDVTGGDGADEINIVYDLEEDFRGYTPTDDTISRGLLRVTDFNPNEDTLVIEVDQGVEGAERNVTVEMDQTEEDGTYTSLLWMTFEKTSEDEESTNLLTIYSSVPFTLDDIELVGFQSATATGTPASAALGVS